MCLKDNFLKKGGIYCVRVSMDKLDGLWKEFLTENGSDDVEAFKEFLKKKGYEVIKPPKPKNKEVDDD